MVGVTDGVGDDVVGAVVVAGEAEPPDDEHAVLPMMRAPASIVPTRAGRTRVNSATQTS